MANDKRYYWLKLKKNFFQQHQIKVLKSLPNGRLYALIYLELMAESTSHDGELRYSKLLPYDIVTLSAVIDEDKDNVEKAIETLINLELVEILDDGTIYLNEVNKMIGSAVDNDNANRQRKFREKKKQEELLCYEDVTKNNESIEYRVKSIENRVKNNKTHFTKPTIEEITEYVSDRHSDVDPNRFYDYYESVGWKVGKNPMKDWKACVRTWERKSSDTRNSVQKQEDILPVYDNSKNNKLSNDELNELLSLRRNKDE